MMLFMNMVLFYMDGRGRVLTFGGEFVTNNYCHKSCRDTVISNVG
jgi:hypothetical protein